MPKASEARCGRIIKKRFIMLGAEIKTRNTQNPGQAAPIFLKTKKSERNAKKVKAVPASFIPNAEPKIVNGISKIWNPYHRSDSYRLITEYCTHGKLLKVGPSVV